MYRFDEKYLPIGTVVSLKNTSKKFMITGFCSIGKENPNKIYDYSGCVYPEGILRFDKIAVFDHNQIERIIYPGFVCEEEHKFKVKLNKLVQDYNESNTNNPTANKNLHDVFNSNIS